MGSLAIFLPYYFSGGPKKIGGKQKYIGTEFFSSCHCPDIVRKSHQNVYSLGSSFLNGNNFENQWVVSVPPPSVSDRVKYLVFYVLLIFIIHILCIAGIIGEAKIYFPFIF